LASAFIAFASPRSADFFVAAKSAAADDTASTAIKTKTDANTAIRFITALSFRYPGKKPVSKQKSAGRRVPREFKRRRRPRAAKERTSAAWTHVSTTLKVWLAGNLRDRYRMILGDFYRTEMIVPTADR
jgi:endonuclease I